MTDTPRLDEAKASYQPFVDLNAVTSAKESYTEHITAIENDTLLSDNGKKAAAARAYLEHTTALGDLRETFEREVDRATVAAEKRLFGPNAADPATLVSHRDALDRADKIKSEAAAVKAIARARFSRDESMVRALTMQAVTKGWDTALKGVEKADPGTANRLTAYRRIPKTTGVTANQVFGIQVPKQFRGKLDGVPNMHELRTWAEK